MARPPWHHCRIAGALVVGGIGRRYGSDKALAVVAGERNIDRGWRALANFTPRWAIAGSHERTALLKRTLSDTPISTALVADDVSGFGPMGGLATGLRLAAAAQVDALALLAVDLPHLHSDYWAWLLNRAPSDTPPALVPRDSGGRWHPLAGLYQVELACAAATAIETSHASLQRFLTEQGAHPVAIEGPLMRVLHNLNSPSDALDVGLTRPG
jgi:molybdopterin-guanine dinucleotide biosynthesis protein A